MNTPLDFSHLNRREFFARSSQIATAGFLGSMFAEAPKQLPKSETLVQQLYGSLSEVQKKTICYAWDHPLRNAVDNNWHINESRVGAFLNPDQQDLVKQIFLNLHSDEYRSEVLRQYNEDNRGDGGFAGASIALFGEPGTGKFEFVLTGRHCTRRCDGDSVEGAAFGGPIFYGHASKNFNEGPAHEGNVYWFQAKRANEVFAALNGKQREKALINRTRKEDGENTVALTGKTRGLEGIPVADLSADQKDLVRKVLADLLKPFRKVDADESVKLIEKNGFDNLHMAFGKMGDIGNDGVWDNWQIEGPSMVWYFRGAPHVHCWVNVRDKA